MLVPRERYDEAVQVAAETMEMLGANDPTDPGTVCGPVISPVQRDRILAYLDQAVEDGGTFATGGGVDESKEDGFWIRPTVIAGLDNTSRVAREEIFGPVLVVIPHDGDDDAVRIANDSPYGLSGSVDSGSVERAKAVAARIRTGTLAINGGVWFNADAPFGGYKQSGIGREMGIAGFEEYLETKLVANLHEIPRDCPYTAEPSRKKTFPDISARTRRSDEVRGQGRGHHRGGAGHRRGLRARRSPPRAPPWSSPISMRSRRDGRQGDRGGRRTAMFVHTDVATRSRRGNRRRGGRGARRHRPAGQQRRDLRRHEARSADHVDGTTTRSS